MSPDAPSPLPRPSPSPPPAPAPSLDAWQAQCEASTAQSDVQIGVAVVVFYLVDSALLLAYWAVGVSPWQLAPLFALTGVVVAGGYVWARRRAGRSRLDNAHAELLQALVALVLMLGVARFQAALALQMLLTVALVIPIQALRLSMLRLLGLCVAAALGSMWVLQHHAGRLSVPIDGRGQQLLTTLFLLWSMVKASSVNIAGLAMRKALESSHSQLAQALSRVEELAERDELTGLANRRRILAVLRAQRERLAPAGAGHAVAMLDLDHFKQVNDRFGHAAGDQVLRTVSQLMRRVLRGDDAVGRLGGEEFVLVLPGACTPADAHRAAERVREAIERHDWSSVHPTLRVTASIGVAIGRPDESLEQLLGRADAGLYRAKHAGRNRVVGDGEGPPAAALASGVAGGQLQQQV